MIGRTSCGGKTTLKSTIFEKSRDSGLSSFKDIEVHSFILLRQMGSAILILSKSAFTKKT